ncbi:hypothetical protein ACTFIR_012114 [Dictyostelium discoideum]
MLIKNTKIHNNFKIFQNIIDFEFLKLIIDYFFKKNELINYILVSKKWFSFISLIISNNIINNISFKHWLKINYVKESFLKSIIKDYFSLNLFFQNITIDDFKAIHDQFEDGKLIYNRILVNFEVLDWKKPKKFYYFMRN